MFHMTGKGWRGFWEGLGYSITLGVAVGIPILFVVLAIWLGKVLGLWDVTSAGIE